MRASRSFESNDNGDGAVSLGIAAYSDDVESTRLLLEAGAKLDVPDRYGFTILDYVINKKEVENKQNHLRVIVLFLEKNQIIKSPEFLFNFLTTCDARNPDVLFILNKLMEQQTLFRKQKVKNVQRLNNKKYEEVKTFHAQLLKVSERMQVSREILKVEGCQIPDTVLDIIRGYDVPLFRLKDSDTLFSHKKEDLDEIRQDLANKHKELFGIRWRPFR